MRKGERLYYYFVVKNGKEVKNNMIMCDSKILDCLIELFHMSDEEFDKILESEK